MNTTTRHLVTNTFAASVIAAAVAVGAVSGTAVTLAVSGPESPSTKITEDSPGWDCRYHGNNVCGPNSDHAPGLYFPDADGLRMVKAWPESQSPEAFWRSLDVNGDGQLGDIELGS